MVDKPSAEAMRSAFTVISPSSLSAGELLRGLGLWHQRGPKLVTNALLTHSAQETSKIPRARQVVLSIIFGDRTFVLISWIFQHQTARCFTSVLITDGMNKNVRCVR